MRPSQILAAVMAMSSVSAAMQVSDALDNIHGLSNVKAVLLGRQDNSNKDNNNNNKPSSDAPKNTQASDQPSQTKSEDNKSASPTDKQSGSAKPSGSQGTKTSGKTQTSFDPRLPAGGVSMITPGALAGDTFYKVGDWVTFAWNFTSLSVTPSAIDVMASCTVNQATYTIAVNMSAKETKVLWDTSKKPDGQAPFLTNKYTLLIYDSNLSASATPHPGYLAPFSGFTFGMYTAQPYVNYTDGYTCANCNGALSHFEKMTLKVLVMTTGTTIGSLLYFTYAFGLW